jgi:hypothetical protein
MFQLYQAKRDTSISYQQTSLVPVHLCGAGDHVDWHPFPG